MKKTTFGSQLVAKKKQWFTMLAVALLSFLGHSAYSQVGTTCENPIVITGLPYTTTDNTANYADNYDPPTASSPVCSTTSSGNYYHLGNDVIYAYTPATNKSINIRMPNGVAWSGMFVYTSCANIGIEYAACATSTTAGNREINNFLVTGGQTYYILLSIWETPSTFAYTLNITENTCANQAATFGIVSNCAVTPGFFATANITSMGSATSLTVTDNQGSAPQVVTATGLVTFGPYTNGTSVNLTVANTTDSNCVVTGTALTQTACPPANDDCAGAITLIPSANTTCAGTTAGTTLGATQSMAAGVCSGTPDDDVWYKFVATASVHTITISGTAAVSGTSTDMYFQVLSGTCGTTTSLLCSDPDTGSVSGLTVGDTYYVRVYSYGSSSRNTFNICVTTPPAAVANDDCAGAVTLTVNTADTCTTVTAGTTANAYQSMGAGVCSGTPDDDVWFKFVAASTVQRITLSDVVAVSGTSTDMYFQVLDGTCGTTTSLLCSDPNTNLVAGLTVGNTYFIRVYTYASTSRATFNICVSTPPAPPANDECAGAITLTVNNDLNCGVTTAGTTVNAYQSMAAGACSGTPDDDVWFKFVATKTMHTISLSNVVAVTGTSTDMYFQVLSGTCGNTTSLLCSDDNSNFVTGLTVGQTYYVRVYSYGTTSRDTFNICIGSQPAPPANDDCANAVTLTVNPDNTCTAVTAATTAGATLSMAATPCSGNPDDDVWFKFVATGTSQKITISDVVALVGTSTDMYFQVMGGACGSTTSLLCSDDNTNTVSGLTVGATYYVRVYSYGASYAQNFNICVSTPPAPPANDDCAGAITLTVNPDLACGTVTAGSTANALQSMGAGVCFGTPDDDVWFKFVATGTSHKISLSNVVAVSGTSTDMYFQVLSGPCGSTTSLLCSDADTNTVTGLTVGSTYYVRVYSYGTSSRDTFNICIGSFPPPPANDLCANATVLNVGVDFATAKVTTTTAGSTYTASGPTPTCDATGFASSGDVWFSVTVPASGKVTIETRGNGDTNVTDTGVAAYSGACAALTALGCNADDGDGNFSKLALTGLTAGQVILVHTWGYNGTSGSFDIAAYDPCAGTLAPTGNAAQTLAPGQKLSNLTVTGTGLTWYSNAALTTTIPNTTTAVSGTTYYVTQTVSGCVSPALAITVTIVDPCAGTLAPTGDAAQTLAPGQTLAALSVTGTNLTWYSNAALTTVVPNTTVAVSGTTYYVTQTVGTCVSPALAVTVTIVDPCAGTLAPAGNASQDLTLGQTLADLSVTGTNLIWYSNAALTTVVPNTTVAVNGTTYYVTQTVGNCVSPALAVTVNVIDPCAGTLAPAGNASQDLTTGQTLADLSVTGTNLIWYSNAALTTMVPNTTVAVDGATYYVTQTVGNCVSPALAVTVNVVDPCAGTLAPAGSAIQDLTTGQTLADLSVTGTNLIWYSNAALTTVVPNTTLAVDGTTYYVTQTVGNCVSPALAVTVNVVDPCAGTLAPAGSAVQDLTTGQTLADLSVTGTNLTWYSDAALTTVVPNTTVAVNGATYYVTQTVGNCVSPALAIIVNVFDPCAGIQIPSGDENQDFNTGETLADLDVTGTGLIWYADAALTIVLPDTTVLTDEATYYATQTVGACTSGALAVTVNEILGRNDFDAASFSYYPNPVVDALNLSYSKEITEVAVYNILGQAVLVKSVNATETSVDLSSLAAATYIVKVTAGDVATSIRIVKK
ncbi:hypothetical protein HYN59_08705 [Flavobacterium album]|uniref:Uncharacterized protein n=1 Tax=Flavobacterium album TaxID=2175091 RepID=A0A2S1QXR5_9FLAO|nr:T9SS type A sorting domain-containing protein [Flavobacterium album]AWH85196.1 hypothetical protein HYN59_08705 [Flavobacterium album]